MIRWRTLCVVLLLSLGVTSATPAGWPWSRKNTNPPADPVPVAVPAPSQPCNCNRNTMAPMPPGSTTSAYRPVPVLVPQPVETVIQTPPGQPIVTAPLAAQPAPAVKPPVAVPLSPEKLIRAVLADQVQAWNKGDLKRFMEGYWKSENLSFFAGKTKTKGWQATLERYQKRYQAEGKEMGQLRFEELEVGVLAPDAAAVRGRWKLKMKKEELGGLFTLIFRKKAEGWRIVHDHTSN